MTYLFSVLRRGEGDAVVLFNGRGGAWRAEITTASRKRMELSPIELVAAQTPPSDLWYGFAPLKAARLDYMMQKATEMGAGIIQPVITRRTQVTRVKLDRMRANALEAAEQCEVLTLPEIREEIGFEALIGDWEQREGDRVLVFADEAAPSGTPVEALGALKGAAGRSHHRPRRRVRRCGAGTADAAKLRLADLFGPAHPQGRHGCRGGSGCGTGDHRRLAIKPLHSVPSALCSRPRCAATPNNNCLAASS